MVKRFFLECNRIEDAFEIGGFGTIVFLLGLIVGIIEGKSIFFEIIEIVQIECVDIGLEEIVGDILNLI